MKVIDLVTKWLNADEMPKKIKYDDLIFEYDELEEDYIPKGGGISLLESISRFDAFEKDIEIIEKQKKIEKIEMVGCNVRVPVLNNELVGTDTPLALETTIVKINELIDEINKLKED